MFAVQYHDYGNPDVLEIGEAPVPHAGPGQVRIAVRAASVNLVDWKTRAGLLRDFVPLALPAIPGVDAAGVVDEVGADVDGAEVGDEVFGVGSATTAQYCLLDMFAPKPAALPWTEAAAMGLAVETAARTLDELDVGAGSVLLIDGGAGGVGSAAIQLARARGATVVATASEGRHDYLRSLGAVPTTYGAGLPARLAALDVGPVDAALDAAGAGSVPELVAIVGNPSQVVSIADFSAPAHGARFSGGGSTRAAYALAQAARLFGDGLFIPSVQEVFPVARAADAHRLSEGGHVQGKIVIEVPAGAWL